MRSCTNVQARPGADAVEEILARAAGDKNQLFHSVINWCEVKSSPLLLRTLVHCARRLVRVGNPEMVASPGVKRTVVAGSLHGPDDIMRIMAEKYHHCRSTTQPSEATRPGR